MSRPASGDTTFLTMNCSALSSLTRRVCIAFLAIGTSLPAVASDFFSTEQPEERFTFGLRLGVNSSNHTMRKSAFNVWNNDSWGAGFTLGAVADLAIRDYISIQPGFFFDYRAGKFSRVSVLYSTTGDPYDLVSVGDSHSAFVTIPILASLHLNITQDLRWNIDAGPYLGLRLGSSDDKQPVETDSEGYILREVGRHNADVGFKLGTSLTLWSGWSFGIHYLAGLSSVWDDGYGGRNKEWTFTLGYDF